MNAEFNWWLLIVGLVVGAGLVWLVIADWSRREEDVSEDERSAESAWIADALRERGDNVDPAAAESILALHRLYLRQSAGLDDSGDRFDVADADEFDDVPNDDVAVTTLGPTEPDETEAAAGPVGAESHESPRTSVRATPLSPRGVAPEVTADPPQR